MSEDNLRLFSKIVYLDNTENYIVFHNWEEDKVILKEMLCTNIYQSINHKKIKTAIKFLSEKNDFLKDKIISDEESFEDWYNGERMEKGFCSINLTNYTDNTNKNELENYYDSDDEE